MGVVTSPAMDSFPSRTKVDDPGFFRSIATQSMIGRLRLVSLAMLVACGPLTIVGFVASPLEGRLVDPFALMFLAVGLGGVVVATVLPVPALEVDTPPEEAQRQSLATVQSRTFLRAALCEASMILGFVASMVTMESPVVPLVGGFLISVTSLLLVAVPGIGVLGRIQDQLERKGATSYMWDALLHVPGEPTR